MPCSAKRKYTWLEGNRIWALQKTDNERQHDVDVDDQKKKQKRGSSSPTSSQRNTLLHPTTTNSRDILNEDDASCIICLEYIDPRDRAVLVPCMHSAMHHHCIATWLFSTPTTSTTTATIQNRKACPLCKCQPTSLIYDIQAKGEQHKEICLTDNSQSTPRITEARRAGLMIRLAEIVTEEGGNGRRVNRNRTGSVGPLASGWHRGGGGVGGARSPTNAATRGTREQRQYQSLSRYQDVEYEEAIRKRKQVYERNSWVEPLSTGTGTGANGHPSSSTTIRRQMPLSKMHRIGEWVERELRALTGDEDVAVVKGFVMGLLSSCYDSIHPPERPHALLPVDVVLQRMGSDHPVSMLAVFLGGARSVHFWHELTAFVTAPSYTLETYDRLVRYVCRDSRRSRSTSRYGGEGRRRQRECNQGGEEGEEEDRWRMWRPGDPVE